MTTAPRKPHIPRAPKLRAENLTAMAFQFEALSEPVHTYTELRWTPDAAVLLEKLHTSLKQDKASKKRLPIRGLRLRVQVRDPEMIGTDRDLGTKSGDRVSRTLGFSGSPLDAAREHANDAVAQWVDQGVRKLAQVDAAAAQDLRKLALEYGAVEAITRREAVFGWDVNRHTGSAKQPPGTRLFATLGDYVANLLTGREIYPGASVLRRVVRKELKENECELMTDVITLDTRKGPVRFSLGVTVSVETYPGRARPIVKIHHKKFVWSKDPVPGKTRLSGYVLPAGATRALRFEVEKNLDLGEDYDVLATEYHLPVSEAIDTPALADNGTSGHYGPHTVVITHRNGRSQGDVALYGVTDLDRRLSFERLEEVLKPAGLTRWTGLEEVPSASKALKDADAGWMTQFADVSEEDDTVRKPLTKQQKAAAERKFTEWVGRMKANIDAHYDGRYHLVLAFAKNLTKDAEHAQQILKTVLGEGATIELMALPANVHGPRSGLPGHELSKPSERAAVRLKAWQPFIDELRSYSESQPDNPVHGVLILARKDRYPGRDDVINKRVARITLSKSLGLTVQYLLPIRTNKMGEPVANAENNYRIRVVNAWRDLAWKSIGKMDRIESKAKEILEAPGRPVLGTGIIRVNRKSGQGNDASFIPYAIELDPVTGTCVGSVMLGRGDNEPSITPFMPLPDLIRALTEYGPSYLARRKMQRDTNEIRRQYTEKFLHQVLLERTRLNPNLIILADASTLSGMWKWLADSELNPANMVLNGQPHAEQDYPDAAFVRIRPDISPKVIMDTPQSRVIIDGEVRPAAKRSDADLYRVTDTAPGMDTYLSFGSKITTSLANAASCYRTTTEANGEPRDPHTGAWQTPNAIDITIVRPGALQPKALAKFVEALRSEYAHFGSWINAPGPLHFASLLKAYVPDYDLSEDDEEEEEVSNMPVLLFA